MLLNKLKVFKSHGKQFIPDLTAVELPSIFRGRPELTECDEQTAEELASMCPTGAITAAPFTLDMDVACSVASVPDALRRQSASPTTIVSVRRVARI